MSFFLFFPYSCLNICPFSERLFYVLKMIQLKKMNGFIMHIYPFQNLIQESKQAGVLSYYVIYSNVCTSGWSPTNLQIMKRCKR